ncbi:MAG: hypothetical protein RL331_192 [Bacteroidota bacterium]
MAQSALNVLSAPNNISSTPLSESNFTVTLNATLTSNNSTVVTNFSRSHSTNMKRGYVFTSTNVNPFSGLSASASRTYVSGLNSTFAASTWAYDLTSAEPTSANCPSLRKGATNEPSVSLANSSTDITFTNPGVYYAWAYTYNSSLTGTGTSFFFYYSISPLVLSVYPKYYSLTGDGEKYYCGLSGITFSEVAPTRWTAQAFPYVYAYYYKDLDGNFQLITDPSNENLSILYTDPNDPTTMPDPYVYYKRGYQIGNDTLWQAEGASYEYLTKISIYKTPELHFDASSSVPQGLFFNSQNDAVDFDISVDGAASSQSIFGYFLPSSTQQFDPQVTSPTQAIAYSPAPFYQFDEVPEGLTLHHVTAQDASDYLAEGESGVFYYVGYSTCYANDNTKYIEFSIPMHKYATPSISSSATFCGSATIADLQSLNSANFDPQYEYQWFESTDLSTQLTLSSPLVNGTNYVVCYVLSGETVKSVPSNELTVTINSLPIVTASTNQSTICAGASLQLTASGADTYSWSNNETTAIISVNPTSSITYTVTGTDLNGCVNTDDISITVNALPNVTASAGQASICSGTSTTLSAVGASTYSWSNNTNPASVSPTSTTTYTVTGTDINGCSNTDEIMVTVNDLPSYTFQGNTSICLGQNTDLTILNSPSGVNSIYHNWSTGASTATINVSPSTTTTYSYIGTGTNGCSTTQQVTVTVNALPTVNAGSNQTVCSGTSVTLSGSGAVNYNWIGGTPNTATYTFTASTSNTYTLMGTDVNGCSNTDEVSVEVVSSPTVTATSSSSSICSSANTSVTLTAGGANTYSWSNGSNTTTASVSPSSTTTYTVTGTNNNGCTSTAQVTVNVDSQNSGGQVYGTGSYCSGESVSQLHIAGHGGSIQWQSSTDNNNFQTIVGATGVTYEPGVLTQTTYYRGLVTNGSCTAYSITGAVNIVSGGWIGAAGTTLINGVQSYDLSNPLNWCGGVPSTPSIPNGVTVYVDGSYDFTNVTIECGGQLVITETGRVNITNVLTNGGIVQVVNGGTIKIGSKVDGSCPGTYKYSETFSPSRYWYVGPTTSNTVRTDFGSVASTNNPTGTQMWSWNETANATNGYIAPIYSSGTTLIPGNGYVYRNLGNTTLDVNVTGPFISSAISHTGLTRTGSGTMAGYHLLSNPYTAYLDADQILTQNTGTVNMVSSMWVRSNTSSAGGVSTMVFDTYNAASGIGTGLGWQIAALNGNTTEINNLLKWIAPMQGFWVRVNNNGTGSVAYNYGMSEANPAGAGQLRSTSPITALARLNISYGEQKDQIVAALSANATNAFESYDSEKMFTSGVVQLYAPNSGKKLAINTLKNNKSKVSMPLTVECPGVGWYTFDLVELQLENGVVFLEDKLNGEMKDLTLDGSYQFYANSGVLQNRFVLHFHLPLTISNVTGPSALEDLVSESQNAQIEINSTSTGKVSVELTQVDENTSSFVRVVDINGKVLESFYSDGNTFDFQISHGQGIYIIEVSNGLTVEKKKVFFQ